MVAWVQWVMATLLGLSALLCTEQLHGGTFPGITHTVSQPRDYFSSSQALIV